MFTANFALMVWMRYRPEPYMLLLIVAAFAAGLVADVLNIWLRPSASRPMFLRLFAFSVPMALSLLYFLVLNATAGIWWRIHLWLGTAIFAGVAGLLLSYLLVPPAIRSAEASGPDDANKPAVQ